MLRWTKLQFSASHQPAESLNLWLHLANSSLVCSPLLPLSSFVSLLPLAFPLPPMFRTFSLLFLFLLCWQIGVNQLLFFGLFLLKQGL